ncbi:MAG: site-specific integrase [Clostridiales bacterium]|nr:site-specific integrase [Clostridiales bacterium]
MGKVKDELLFLLIKNYLTVYLPVHRKVSDNTITSYRTAINQFLNYVADTKGISLLAVKSEMFSYEMVSAYPDYISKDLNLSPATRNSRLAAIRAFIAYASACKPEYISLCSELSAIKIQKEDVFAKVDYMSEAAVKALFDEPDTATEIGLRDQFLMIFLYDTGGRIQEVLNVKLNDIKLGGTPTVTLFGKGRKVRTVPLMKDTVSHLRNYLNVFHKGTPMLSDEWLFYTIRKGIKTAISDDAVRIRLQKYADAARMKCPEVPEKVYPHLWRHTRAMHLYQHGMDLTMVSQWLGHSQIKTTEVYAYADTEAKRKAIETAMADNASSPSEDIKYTVTDEEILKRLYGL